MEIELNGRVVEVFTQYGKRWLRPKSMAGALSDEQVAPLAQGWRRNLPIALTYEVLILRSRIEGVTARGALLYLARSKNHAAADVMRDLFDYLEAGFDLDTARVSDDNVHSAVMAVMQSRIVLNAKVAQTFGERHLKGV